MTSRYWSKRVFTGCVLATLLNAAQVAAHEPESPGLAPKRPSTVNTPAPAFVLVDQENQPFASTKLRGKTVVLNFIFTTCTDVCPLFTAKLVQLQRKLNGQFGSELFFVSVTTDPEIDSPKVLKAYALRHGADLENWAFLTGSEAQLKSVWRSYSLQVIRRKRGLVQHTSLTTVIDRTGLRRQNYWGERWSLEDLERDLLAVLTGGR